MNLVSPVAVVSVAMALTCSAIGVCGWLEHRINVRARPGSWPATYDPNAPIGKRYKQKEE